MRLSLPSLLLAAALPLAPAAAGDLPPHEKILDGYDKVVSTADGAASLWTVYTRKSDGQMLLELPRSFAKKKYFIALTVASGNRFAGLQSGDLYVQWRRYDDKLLLLRPNVEIRSTGDDDSKASVARLFTDEVLLQIDIETIGPGGGPVIDGDAFFVDEAEEFFGEPMVDRQYRKVFDLKSAKAFPGNIEIAFEVVGPNGRLQTLHYSVSRIESNPKYKPRKADARIGYFTTAYSDYGKYDDDESRTRYINRWHLEKADGDLRTSPPKEPIVFYIEHTTPVRYRRWVRAGVLAWNEAFENIGITDAIEVRYQDSASGAHMEKDPEDVRYNFVRWLNNDVGTAIGPSRVDPLTGQILDADIILTDGWIRYFKFQFEDLLPQIATEGFDAETLAWLAERPRWNPYVRLAEPSERSRVAAEFASRSLGGHEARRDTSSLGHEPHGGLFCRGIHDHGHEHEHGSAVEPLAFDVAAMRLHISALRAAEAADGDDAKKDDEADSEKALIDGMPESFVGPLLANLVAHEVGHTLGLRHNFKGSALHDLATINSEDFEGDVSSSVMDYVPTNIRVSNGETQGPFVSSGIGPYDLWAIEFGYGPKKNLKKVLARVAEPELQFATDEDTTGPDPLARRYDFGSDPLEFAKEQIRLAEYHRERLLTAYVEDGESWSKAREGYSLTLALQTRSIGMMANWIGGAFVYRDKKGDPGDREPIEVVDADTQRAALAFVLEHSFRDEAYGLTPELLRYIPAEKWLDGDDWTAAFRDATWPVHDRVSGLQATVLTMLMNPTTLRRVYDNEFTIDPEADAFTLPELLASVRGEVWRELSAEPEGEYSARRSFVSSLRRNLQREHLSRLTDLITSDPAGRPAASAVAELARQDLREILDELDEAIDRLEDALDPYTRAHWADCVELIERSLEADVVYGGGGGGGVTIRFGASTPAE